LVDELVDHLDELLGCVQGVEIFVGHGAMVASDVVDYVIRLLRGQSSDRTSAGWKSARPSRGSAVPPFALRRRCRALWRRKCPAPLVLAWLVLAWVVLASLVPAWLAPASLVACVVSVCVVSVCVVSAVRRWMTVRKPCLRIVCWTLLGV
jgi:hypothetical protein